MCSALLWGLGIYVILWVVCPPVAGILTALVLGWIISRLLIFFFGICSGEK
ncbi:MAG: hypothetical protein KBC96_12155 [Armatimonadetes bacterium]|nr:hypothetical protein [Armatimonadota bacterium]